MAKAVLFIAITLFLLNVHQVNAQIMDSNVVQDDHTIWKETKGKEVWQKLQNKEVFCPELAYDDFGALGEYFMGQMAGESHAAMNRMMIERMGEEGERRAHAAMGKRISGCDSTAAFPSQGMGGMPMMQMMMGSMMGGWNGANGMMGGWSGATYWFGSLVYLIWLLVGILAILWLFKQITKKKS